jgi:hypothetical protein
MATPSITQPEFEELTKSLATEIQSAAVDYRMYEDLAKAADSHPIVVLQSRAFWDMTIQSHLNSAILRLCRVYDQQVSSMNLAKWLRLIKGHPAWFTGQPLDAAKLDQDISYASNKNPKVENLTKYRGNVVAHLGQNYVLNVRNTRHSFNLTHGDVKELLKSGLRIVNHYSTIYNGHSWSADLIGADDHQFIFRELEKAIARTKAQQLAGFEKFRGISRGSDLPPY